MEESIKRYQRKTSVKGRSCRKTVIYRIRMVHIVMDPVLGGQTHLLAYAENGLGADLDFQEISCSKMWPTFKKRIPRGIRSSVGEGKIHTVRHLD